MVSTEYTENYYKTLSLLFNSIKVTDKEGNEIEFFHGIENVCSLIRLNTDSGCKLMFIGNGASAAKARKCNVITLSGFKDDNPLNVMGDYNFFVPAQEYGPVEIIHHSICHSISGNIIHDTPSSGKQV